MRRKSPKLLKRVRYLTLGLLVSGAVNIALLGACLYFVTHEYEISADYKWDRGSLAEVERDAPLSVAAALPSYEALTFEQLVGRLSNRRPLEDGYREQDLALATLVALHDFDLDRAVGGRPVEKRIVRFNGQKAGHLPALVLFPGLSKEQFQQIQLFARQEEWPLTSRGLFRRLKKDSSPSLVEAFTLTNEFYSVRQLFVRSGVGYEKEELVILLADGNWKVLSDFDQKCRQTHDFSSTCRREFLLVYIGHGSSVGAELLVRTDRNYVSDILDDRMLIAVVSRLGEPSAHTRSFLIDLLVSPRSTAVWIAAAERLYAFSEEAMPQPYNHIETLTRFVPEEMLRERVELGKPKKAEKPITLYEVREGDSLWKIAKLYETTVAKIRLLNHLESDLIRRGQAIVIPD